MCTLLLDQAVRIYAAAVSLSSRRLNLTAYMDLKVVGAILSDPVYAGGTVVSARDM